MPAPTMALTRLDVAPATVLLFSRAAGGSFLTRREVPPGVEIWTTFRGVEGAKKGEDGGGPGGPGPPRGGMVAGAAVPKTTVPTTPNAVILCDAEPTTRPPAAVVPKSCKPLLR